MPGTTKDHFYTWFKKGRGNQHHQKSVLVFGEEACTDELHLGLDPFALYELYLIKKVIFSNGNKLQF